MSMYAGWARYLARCTGIVRLAAMYTITFAALLLSGCADDAKPLLPVPHGFARGADIVIVTLDTTRADHLGCYGRSPSVTPNLDRLCREGTRFDNAVTSTPVTLPAHASIMTGLLPNRHGVRYNGEFRLAPGIPVLAEEFAAAGYQTAAFVGSFVLDARFGLARGFDTYDDRVEGAAVRRGIVSRNERSADAVTDAALDHLARRDPQRPVFLWVHYFDAHAPYAPIEQPAEPGDAAAYAAEIADMDRALGRLLASPALDLERAVVIVASDHGEGLGEHDERTHGLFLYESTMRIPLILRLPAAHAAGRIEDGLVTLVDLRPSLLGLAGLKPAQAADGIDWFSARRGPEDVVYMEASLPFFDYGFAPLYALRQSAAKFIEAPIPEYYDLQADPREAENRFDELGRTPGNRVERLRQRLDAIMLDAPDIATAAADTEPADHETLARLRSLGYLGDAAPTPGTVLRDPKTMIDAVNLHQAAILHLDGGRPAAALDLLRKANALASGNPGMLRLKYKAELQLGLIEDAESTLGGMLEVRRNPDSLVLLAQIRVLRADFSAAGILLDEAERLDPRHGGIAIARGDIALRAGDPATAEGHYRKALDVDGSRVGAIARARLRQVQAGNVANSDRPE